VKTFLLILIVSLSAAAKSNANYYIDSYDKGEYELYVITIDDCATSFKVPKKHHQALLEDDFSLSKMVDISLERSKNGCK